MRLVIIISLFLLSFDGFSQRTHYSNGNSTTWTGAGENCEKWDMVIEKN